MPMPRYNLRAAMGIFAILAIWLASFRMEFEAGFDLRRGIYLMGFVASVACALYYRGKSRALPQGAMASSLELLS